MKQYYPYPKTVTRLPRKFKKKLKKIPFGGDDCFGSAIGDKGRMINGKLVFKPIMCPFFQIHYCGLRMVRDNMFLDDFLKICDYEKFSYLANPDEREDSYQWSWGEIYRIAYEKQNPYEHTENLAAKAKYLRKKERVENHRMTLVNSPKKWK